MSNEAFSKEIVTMTQEILNSGEVEQVMRDKIKSGIEDAIDSAFRWGDLKEAIEERVNETMVPFIKEYDFGKYLVKLDVMLQEIIDQTGMQANKEILQSFQRLMSIPDEKEISLEKLFEEYCKHVSDACDTDDLEVDLDDDPTYESIETHAEIIPCERRGYAHICDYAILNFWAEGQEDLSYSVMLRRYGEKYPWEISYDANPYLKELPSINEFEILLIAMTRCRANLIYEDEALEDWITPDAVPEANYC